MPSIVRDTVAQSVLNATVLSVIFGQTSVAGDRLCIGWAISNDVAGAPSLGGISVNGHAFTPVQSVRCPSDFWLSQYELLGANVPTITTSIDIDQGAATNQAVNVAVYANVGGRGAFDKNSATGATALSKALTLGTGNWIMGAARGSVDEAFTWSVLHSLSPFYFDFADSNGDLSGAQTPGFTAGSQNLALLVSEYYPVGGGPAGGGGGGGTVMPVLVDNFRRRT